MKGGGERLREGRKRELGEIGKKRESLVSSHHVPSNIFHPSPHPNSPNLHHHQSKDMRRRRRRSQACVALPSSPSPSLTTPSLHYHFHRTPSSPPPSTPLHIHHSPCPQNLVSARLPLSLSAHSSSDIHVSSFWGSAARLVVFRVCPSFHLRLVVGHR